MPTAKTATLTFRIEPALKEALRIAAAQEHRSIANMVAFLIRAHCRQNGINISGHGGTTSGNNAPMGSSKSMRQRSRN